MFGKVGIEENGVKCIIVDFCCNYDEFFDGSRRY